MGQKSAVDKLPQNLRQKLIDMLQNPAVTQAEVVDAINAEAGEQLVSKSSINRYSQRMKVFAEKKRQAKEIADAYMEKYGSDDRQKLGKVINEQMRVAIFDLMGEFDDIRSDPDVKGTEAADMLYKISRGLKELEQAEKLNAERTDGIRKAALAEAADVVEKEAKSVGLSEATMDLIKRKILGI
ncbi:hypothetical protein FACS189468_6640 [Spirochaetia bacterium]|nr:hypothetical protein FACS189468_6640 [Spirochaetia bacterium]